jgi:ribosomal protein L37E
VKLPCDRCGRDIPADDLATGICWSCGFMYDIEKVTDGFYLDLLEEKP